MAEGRQHTGMVGGKAAGYCAPPLAEAEDVQVLFRQVGYAGVDGAQDFLSFRGDE